MTAIYTWFEFIVFFIARNASAAKIDLAATEPIEIPQNLTTPSKKHYYLSKGLDKCTNLNGDVSHERNNGGIKVLCTTIARNVVSHYPRA